MSLDLEAQAQHIVERTILLLSHPLKNTIVAELRRSAADERAELQATLEKARALLAESMRARATLSAETYYAEARNLIRKIDLTLSLLEVVKP